MKQLNQFHAHIRKSPLQFRKEPSSLPKEPLIRSISWSESSPPYPPPRVWPCRCSLNEDPSVSGCGPQSGGSSYLKKKKDFSFISGLLFYRLKQGGMTMSSRSSFDHFRRPHKLVQGQIF